MADVLVVESSKPDREICHRLSVAEYGALQEEEEDKIQDTYSPEGNERSATLNLFNSLLWGGISFAALPKACADAGAIALAVLVVVITFASVYCVDLVSQAWCHSAPSR